MPRDDDIDTQVKADWEFTRRAEQLMDRLRTQGKTGPVPSGGDQPALPDETPEE
jgi:hypothetical protein